MVEFAPKGFRVVTANLGVKDESTDFCLIVSDSPAAVSGLFTLSRFVGPSVGLSRDVVASGEARGVVVVSKNANVANGPEGDADAASLQRAAAELAGIDAGDLVVASTGVIGRRYPMERMERGIGAVQWPPAAAGAKSFEAAARAIMTTDTHPKAVSVQVPTTDGSMATVLGIAKGVGMIEPNMATLLTFFFTDAEVNASELDGCFRRVIATTFNALSIDSDTSTSDSAVTFANGAAGPVELGPFEAAVREVALDLVLMIAADGEGASKVLEVQVTGGRDDAQAKLVAKAIVNSPLVKTAVHGADPNWGRVVMAVGKCDDQDDIDQHNVTVTIGEHQLYPGAVGAEDLAAVEEYMTNDHVVIGCDLGVGPGAFTAYGCDLTDGYIRINADYTT